MRFLAAGAICGGMVHEFANLLTVVDGDRQMAEMGMARRVPDRAREPLERSRHLIDAFRHVFATRDEDCASPARVDLECLAAIVRLRLRGRRCHVAVREAGLDGLCFPARCAAQARLCLLAVVLASLESVDAYGVVELRAEGRPGRVCVAGAVLHGGAAASSVDEDLALTPLASAAEALASEIGARMQRHRDANSLYVELLLPA